MIRFIKTVEAVNSFGGNFSGKSTLIVPAGEPSPVAFREN
ncbi:hypothetical protein COO91_09778 (plasmid) [Nostoc flagelliforme CCNUN1]|uniref:Uncharacterized protein n=1 Tax=Nostoc flagelliforme CCNUN1 TaxID=2038116 RepID=A0A2K8T7C7_9NOSO|nr:hypothetical protein COO91_09778 [Nostoc flagelliforme CCNUN1]